MRKRETLYRKQKYNVAHNPKAFDTVISTINLAFLCAATKRGKHKCTCIWINMHIIK